MQPRYFEIDLSGILGDCVSTEVASLTHSVRLVAESLLLSTFALWTRLCPLKPVDAVTRTDWRVPPSRSDLIGVPVLSEPPVISNLYPARVLSPSPTKIPSTTSPIFFLGIGIGCSH